MGWEWRCRGVGYGGVMYGGGSAIGVAVWGAVVLWGWDGGAERDGVNGGVLGRWGGTGRCRGVCGVGECMVGGHWEVLGLSAVSLQTGRVLLGGPGSYFWQGETPPKPPNTPQAPKHPPAPQTPHRPPSLPIPHRPPFSPHSPP